MGLFVAAPDIFVGDAVGNHCMSLVRAARRLGWEAQAYAQRFSGDVLPIDTMFDRVGADDTLLVSYSIYDPLLEQLLALPGRKLCYFHGVTAPQLLEAFEPVTAELCARSRDQYPLLGRFDKLMANSRWTAGTLAPHTDPDSVLAIPPVSADMPVFQYQSQRNSTRGARMSMLVVGRVVPHKTVEDAIAVLANVRAAGIDADLKVIGSAPNGAYSAFLAGQANAAGLAAHVEFAGMVSDSALFSAFDAADILLSVSRHEGFCVPVLEAMHLGLPSVVRRGTAADEVGEGAAIGFDTPREAAAVIATLHGDDARRAAAVAAGRVRARDVLAQAGDQVVAEVLAGPRRVA